MSRIPRKMLLGDEGNSALHYFDLDDPRQNWSYRGPGRDLQLIGKGRVLRSSPTGFVELDLTSQGAVVRDVALADLPGGVESARRLLDGSTIVLGNGGGGIFVWEIDSKGNARRKQLFAGIEKGRMLRLTAQKTMLFCSDTNSQRVIHEATFEDGIASLFTIPGSVPVDSPVKAVREADDIVTVSTGYTASLLRINTAKKTILQTIGGKEQPDPPGLRRPLRPFFFSGYQMFATGDFLVANWQGHGTHHNAEGYQFLLYDRVGRLVWQFDQSEYPIVSSLNNVIALDGLDVGKLHDEPGGVLIPLA